jgi:hypothetical protein
LRGGHVSPVDWSVQRVVHPQGTRKSLVAGRSTTTFGVCSPPPHDLTQPAWAAAKTIVRGGRSRVPLPFATVLGHRSILCDS